MRVPALCPWADVTRVYFGPIQASHLTMDSQGVLYGTDFALQSAQQNVVKFDLPSQSATVVAGGFQDPVGIAFAPAGGAGAGALYVADYSAETIDTIAPSGSVSILAGTLNQPGSLDGHFLGPEGIVVDGSGTLFVSDQGNNVIRKVMPDGSVSTIAGSASAGYEDGKGAAARFSDPLGISTYLRAMRFTRFLRRELLRSLRVTLTSPGPTMESAPRLVFAYLRV